MLPCLTPEDGTCRKQHNVSTDASFRQVVLDVLPSYTEIINKKHRKKKSKKNWHYFKELKVSD